MAPRFDTKLNASLIARRAPLSDYNNVPSNKAREVGKSESGGPTDCHLTELHSLLKKLVDSKPGQKAMAQEEEAEDPKVNWRGQH